MHQMQLSPEQVQYAIARFNEGKRENFPLEDSLARLRRECGRRHDLYRAFVDIQLKVVLADGNMHASVRTLLWQICQALGVSRVELAQLEAMARAQRVFTGHEPVATPSAAGEAYKVLGVEPDADDATVKRAYRRLMNQHHPDKLLARGLPQSMASVAEERTLEIRGAYDTIRRARGMK
jgi:DnaJ like chaperone protein